MSRLTGVVAGSQLSGRDPNSWPILVCGHGRCGSSLMMKMLEAGGVPVHGDFPAYEPDDVGLDRDIVGLLPRLVARAAKILDPHHSAWPSAFSARVIWLDRNREQQAKSQLKFLRFFNPGIDIPTSAWRTVAASFGGDTKRSLEIFSRAGCAILRLRFEDILASPTHAATQVGTIVGAGFDVVGAASVVLNRSSDCAPDCDIEMRGIIEAEATGRG